MARLFITFCRYELIYQYDLLLSRRGEEKKKNFLRAKKVKKNKSILTRFFSSSRFLTHSPHLHKSLSLKSKRRFHVSNKSISGILFLSIIVDKHQFAIFLSKKNRRERRPRDLEETTSKRKRETQEKNCNEKKKP